MYPVAVQSYANNSAVSWLELLPIRFDCGCVCYQDTVGSDPRLNRPIPDGALLAIARSAGCEDAYVVTEDTAAERLIEGDPFLHLRAERCEHYSRVMNVIRNEFGLVQEAAISVVKCLWQIPVEECDHGFDSVRK